MVYHVQAIQPKQYVLGKPIMSWASKSCPSHPNESRDTEQANHVQGNTIHQGDGGLGRVAPPTRCRIPGWADYSSKLSGNCRSLLHQLHSVWSSITVDDGIGYWMLGIWMWHWEVETSRDWMCVTLCYVVASIVHLQAVYVWFADWRHFRFGYVLRGYAGMCYLEACYLNTVSLHLHICF